MVSLYPVILRSSLLFSLPFPSLIPHDGNLSHTPPAPGDRSEPHTH